MMKANFIVVEGLEGAGKSTAIKTVLDTLKAAGIEDIVNTREPGGTPLAEKNARSGERRARRRRT